jgi:transcriptional regulator with XRE-family HTH domain
MPGKPPFKERFADRRRRMGLTLRAMAAESGIKLRTLWGIEAGEHYPTAERIRAIAGVFARRVGSDDPRSEYERQAWEKLHDALAEIL